MPDGAFRKVLHDSLTDQVVGEIRRLILTGAIRPGAMLPSQTQLADQLGVGVATIRRAVAALSAIGLLESKPGRGTTVNPDGLAVLQASALLAGPLDPTQVSMIYEAREAIETRLTELASQRATPEDLIDIRQALEDMKASMDNDGAFTAADLRFHFAVARAGHNGLLAQFYNVSRQLLTDVISQMITLRGIKVEAIQVQWEVYEGILAGDPVRARDASKRQFQQVAELLTRAGYIMAGDGVLSNSDTIHALAE